MKNTILKSVLIISLISLMGVSSCRKWRDDRVQNHIERNIEKGTWRIILFIDSGVDETTHFAGYNFSFKGDGTLIAINGVNDYRGTWSITDDGSSDDSFNDLHFNINFNLLNDFQDLNNAWHFISETRTKIKLKDECGGKGGNGGGPDYLTFEKN